MMDCIVDTTAVNYEEEEDAVEEIIVRRLEAFHKAHLDAEGYKVLVEDNNFNNNLTSHQIFLIRQKCKYLYHSLCIALEQKCTEDKKMKWVECCEQAIKKMTNLKPCHHTARSRHHLLTNPHPPSPIQEQL
jgi:hypothetical protein